MRKCLLTAVLLRARRKQRVTHSADTHHGGVSRALLQVRVVCHDSEVSVAAKGLHLHVHLHIVAQWG